MNSMQIKDKLKNIAVVALTIPDKPTSKNQMYYKI